MSHLSRRCGVVAFFFKVHIDADFPSRRLEAVCLFEPGSGRDRVARVLITPVVDVGDSDPLAVDFVADGDFHTGQTAVGDGISNSE